MINQNLFLLTLSKLIIENNYLELEEVVSELCAVYQNYSDDKSTKFTKVLLSKYIIGSWCLKLPSNILFDKDNKIFYCNKIKLY